MILRSSVVSRYHAELRYMRTHWEIISLGHNGTYFSGESITQMPLVDGMVINLPIAGPMLQINLGSTAQQPMHKAVPRQRCVTPAEKTQQQDTFIQDPKHERGEP